MSNRRRLPSEKARRPRCNACRSPLVFKNGYGLVCAECGTVPAPPVTVPEPEGGDEG